MLCFKIPVVTNVFTTGFLLSTTLRYPRSSWKAISTRPHVRTLPSSVTPNPPSSAQLQVFASTPPVYPARLRIPKSVPHTTLFFSLWRHRKTSPPLTKNSRSSSVNVHSNLSLKTCISGANFHVQVAISKTKPVLVKK